MLTAVYGSIPIGGGACARIGNELQARSRPVIILLCYQVPKCSYWTIDPLRSIALIILQIIPLQIFYFAVKAASHCCKKSIGLRAVSESKAATSLALGIFYLL